MVIIRSIEESKAMLLKLEGNLRIISEFDKREGDVVPGEIKVLPNGNELFE